MSRPSKPLAVLVVLLLFLTGACKGDAKRAAITTTTSSSTSTSTSTSTTVAPPTTVAAPPLSAGTKVVFTRTGVVAPVVRVNPDGTVTIRTPCQNTVAVAGAIGNYDEIRIGGTWASVTSLPVAVPEPSSALLFALSGVALGAFRKRS